MAPQKPKQKRALMFSFSPAGLFALFLFAIIALAWAFIFGLLLGRGYQPEELIPEIAQIMPTPPPPPPNVAETLRPEDLNFYEQLKNIPIREEPVAPNPQKTRLLLKEEKNPDPIRTEKNNQSLSKPKTITPEKLQQAAVKSEVQEQQAPDETTKVQEQQAPDETTKVQVQQAPDETTKKKTPVPPKKEEARFFYRYQIASLNDGATALGVQKTLEAKGMTASTTKIKVKGKNWYRIFVEIKGTEQDVKATAVKLKSMGFSDMILADKKRLN